MPSRNFSADLLQRAPEKVVVMKLEDVLWSDWGKPERIVRSLDKIGRHPAFHSFDPATASTWKSEFL